MKRLLVTSVSGATGDDDEGDADGPQRPAETVEERRVQPPQLLASLHKRLDGGQAAQHQDGRARPQRRADALSTRGSYGDVTARRGTGERGVTRRDSGESLRRLCSK